MGDYMEAAGLTRFESEEGADRVPLPLQSRQVDPGPQATAHVRQVMQTIHIGPHDISGAWYFSGKILAGDDAMLVVCRLAGLSALETYYAGVRVGAQFGPRPV